MGKHLTDLLVIKAVTIRDSMKPDLTHRLEQAGVDMTVR